MNIENQVENLMPKLKREPKQKQSKNADKLLTPQQRDVLEAQKEKEAKQAEKDMEGIEFVLITPQVKASLETNPQVRKQVRVRKRKVDFKDEGLQ